CGAAPLADELLLAIEKERRLAALRQMSPDRGRLPRLTRPDHQMSVIALAPALLSRGRRPPWKPDGRKAEAEPPGKLRRIEQPGVVFQQNRLEIAVHTRNYP